MTKNRAEWRRKAAELMCIGLRQPALDDMTRELIDAGVSGVLLYDLELPDPERTRELISLIRSRAGRPLFVAVDQEGATHSRLQNGFTPLPSLWALGQKNNPELASELGKLIAREMRAVGIDLVLGPVLDVATNPDNTLIGERAAGRDAVRVATITSSLIRSMQSEGLRACGKHFPGHGDTTFDSNVQLPILNHRMARLESVELVPFEAAVQARVAAIMVAHVLFPALDPDRPASISRPILYGILRQRLGYRGMVISDDVGMRAIADHFSPAEIAMGGIEAGVDCFLCARQPEDALRLADALADAVMAGRILPERIESARRRVRAMLHATEHREREADLSVIGSEAHRAIVERIGGS